MYEGLSYDVYESLNKIKFSTAAKSLGMGSDMRSAIFAIRECIKGTGKALNISPYEFADICKFNTRRDLCVYVGHIINTLKAQNLLIMPEKYREGNLLCYGTPELIVTTKTGEDYKLPLLFSIETPKELQDRYRKMNNYYVYVCKHDGVVVYVGKGSKERLLHCTSGKSSSKDLNNLVISGAFVSVEKIAENLTEEMALHLESSYIRAMINSGHALYNKKLPSDVSQNN